MNTRPWYVECLGRLYGTLLYLYPKRFRSRFGAEMVQVFLSCCKEEETSGNLPVFLLRSFADLAFSIMREQQRTVLPFIEGLDPFLELADTLLIPFNVGLNLMVLGPVITALVMGVSPEKIPPVDFAISSAVSAFFVGCMAVIRAVLVARRRRRIGELSIRT